MELSLIDLYRIGRNAVRFFPATEGYPCLQLQTFRVLQRDQDQDIDSENLGAVPTDKDTPFFWSRKWEAAKFNPNRLEFDFPLLTMFEVVNEFKKPAFDKGNQRCYTLEMSVWDKYREECVNGSQTGCNARPVNQIYLDTELLLDSVLQFFGGIIGATTSADSTEKLYYEPHLRAMLSDGTITGYSPTYSLRNTLNAHNGKDARFIRVERPLKKTYGTKVQLIFCTSRCNTIEYENTLPDPGLLGFEAGCKNC